MSATDDDPEDSPLVRQVLYTNDVTGLLSAIVAALLFRARPERVKKALEYVLENWDERVESARAMAKAMEDRTGEPSGWQEPEGNHQ